MNTKVWIPLSQLLPRWVEFTDTKGVLRCLQPQEEPNRAKGIIFLCPSCLPNKNKKHFSIFLFPDAPAEARPQGRFLISRVRHKAKLREMKSFDDVSLYEVMTTRNGTTAVVQPRDVCGWRGMVVRGKVYQ